MQLPVDPFRYVAAPLRGQLGGWLATTMLGLAAVLLGALMATATAGAPHPLPARGVWLLMIEEPGCPYCRRFDREVRDGYLNSAEGRHAPLIRRLKGDASVNAVADVRYSPTFVLLQDGREVGRIVGYPGADFFWSMLAELLPRTGFPAATPSSSPAAKPPS